MRKAVILIHGFNEDCEISFSQFLSSVKLKRYAIIKHTISGHGNSNDEFNYNSELNEIEDLAKKVTSKYKEVTVIGFSLGGVLASYIASRYKIDKLILIAPAFKYISSGSIPKHFLLTAKEVIKSRNIKQGLDNFISSNFKDKDTFIQDLIDHEHELPSLTNFIRLVEIVKSRIEEINCPTLIIHGECDELIPISSSLYILSKVSNKNKHLIIAPTMLHRVLNDENAKPYHLMIKYFIKKGNIYYKQ